MLGNIPVVSVPSTQNVASRPRKESIYDTEAVAAGAHPAEIRIFDNFGAFSAGTVSGLTKTRGRDTNLSGRAGLEKAQHVFWFSVTAAILVRNSEIQASIPNQAIFDDIRQCREMMDFQFIFSDTPYLRQPYSEIPSGGGPTDLSTTHTDQTIFNVLAWGSPHRSNDYSVQIMARPVEITELETFSVLLSYPQQPVTLAIAIFHQVHLRGIRLKGITG